MRATAVGVAGALGLMLGLLAALPEPAATPGWRPAAVAAAPPAFPPPRLQARAPRPLLAARNLDEEIVRLGAAAPRDALRAAFEQAPDLAAFALERLAAASGGDGASQYALYLALDECRDFLHRDFAGLSANLERMVAVSDLGPEESVAWAARLARCRGFAVADWSALGTALAEEQPGDAVEYAAAWFERAVRSGYAPALAEQALRPGPYGRAEREALLARALAAGGPEVYWLLFAHSAEVQDGAVTTPALAWLIAACRAGKDCSENAGWYRAYICAGPQGCVPGQSALEYYWQAVPALERARAWQQANELEGLFIQNRWREMPVPPLEHRDLRRLWAAA